MKKIVELNYLTPLEFVAIYTRAELIGERDSFEEEAKMPVVDIIAHISRNNTDGLIRAFENFAPEVGFEYCEQHDIFHEYEKCPFCQLGIRVTDKK